MQIVNIAAYKFVAIPSPAEWQPHVKTKCDELALRGTVLLATEGINLTVAGVRQSIDTFLHFLRNDEVFLGRFSDLEVKESLSAHQPFRKMIVRLPKEIITMKKPMIQPEGKRAPAIEPLKLKRWLDQGCDDDGREIVLLDTRNDYEVKVGTFKNALDLNIEVFSEFPDAVRETIESDASAPEKTFVSFCTGGIRCEKAALYMQEVGFRNVFQLDGGILKYFEEVGGAHWNGECFVFDERVAVDPKLQESKSLANKRTELQVRS